MWPLWRRRTGDPRTLLSLLASPSCSPRIASFHAFRPSIPSQYSSSCHPIAHVGYHRTSRQIPCLLPHRIVHHPSSSHTSPFRSPTELYTFCPASSSPSLHFSSHARAPRSRYSPFGAEEAQVLLLRTCTVLYVIARIDYCVEARMQLARFGPAGHQEPT